MRKLLLYLPLPFLIAFLIFVCLWIANGIPHTKGWPYQWCRLNSLQIDSCLNLLYLVFALRFSICFIMQAYRLYGMLMPRRKWVHLLCYRSIILKSYHKFPQQRAGYPLVQAILDPFPSPLWRCPSLPLSCTAPLGRARPSPLICKIGSIYYWFRVGGEATHSTYIM
jgi:hypothetical protein